MRRIFLSPVFLVFLLVSCVDDKTSGCSTFALSDFESVNVSISESVPLECKDLFLGRPMSLVYHPDDFLLVRDSRPSRQLTVVDLRKMTSSSEVNRGRSANELLYLWDVSVLERDVYLSSLNDNKLLKMKYDSDGRTFKYEETFVVPESFLRCVPIQDGYLTFASVTSKHRFHIWDKDMEIRDTLGTFPTERITSDILLDNAVLQSVLAVAPDGHRFATAYIGADCIDIYDDRELSARLWGPERHKLSVKTKSTFDGRQFSFLTPDITVFTHLAATETSLYAGYVGTQIHKHSKFEQDNFKIKMILSFSWTGKPLKAYILDKPVDSFCVDERSGTFYFLISNPEYEIRYYKNHIIVDKENNAHGEHSLTTNNYKL